MRLHIRMESMRVRFYSLLLLLVFLACPGSTALAADKETHWATFRLPVYWISRSDPDARKSHRQVNENRSLVYQLERKGHEREKNKSRALWHLTRSYRQFHSDPDPKKSGWTFQTDRVYNYEIKGWRQQRPMEREVKREAEVNAVSAG